MPDHQSSLIGGSTKGSAVFSREWLHAALFDTTRRLGRSCNSTICLLIVITVLVSMANTVPIIHEKWGDLLQRTEIALTVIFTIEYLLRLWAMRPWTRYAFSFYGMVDLLAILPLFLGMDSNIAVRLLRVFRLVKVTTHLPAMRLLYAMLYEAGKLLGASILTIWLVSLIAGNIIYTLEPGNFQDAFEGAWWGLVTMSTVGYGDVVPHSMIGRFLAAVLILIGVTMFGMVTAVISMKIGRLITEHRKCSHCGANVALEYAYCPHCATPRRKPGM